MSQKRRKSLLAKYYFMPIWFCGALKTAPYEGFHVKFYSLGKLKSIYILYKLSSPISK